MVYLLHSSIKEQDLERTREILGESNQLLPIKVQDLHLENAPVTSRYPQEMYYRIFAARYLPSEVDRVLYLDPDLVVNGDLRTLYETPLDDALFAAASHIKKMMHKINEIRLSIDEESPYINSGVMLMNLALLRKEQKEEDVFRYIEEHKNVLLLPDQDVISGLYGSRILPLDPYRYNMTERLFALHLSSDAWLDLEWVRKNSVIIHYCGRNKPWKTGYVGQLDIFYKEVESKIGNSMQAAR